MRVVDGLLAVGGLLICIFLLLMIPLYSDYLDNKSEMVCRNETKVWSMWNNVSAAQLGVSSDELVNITYAYLYDNTIWCGEKSPDCFIDVPVQRCCFYDKNTYDMYCHEDLIGGRK